MRDLFSRSGRYVEKFYFRTGNTGFRVWDTKFGRLGAGICWDQWFPEAARAMVLEGAEADGGVVEDWPSVESWPSIEWSRA